MESGTKQVIFVQVSHELTAPVNPSLDYYKQVYSRHDGFDMPRHYMEYPTWIAVIAGMLPDKWYEKSLHVVTDVQASIDYLNEKPMNAIVLMSAMDVNKDVLIEIVTNISQTVIMGGYVNPDHFNEYVIWCENVNELSACIPHVLLNAAPDYSLFDEPTIPRLTLSEGCLHNCAFCTIERGIVEISWEQVRAQVRSFEGMKFKLVYLNDKTFGQASNWERLWELWNEITQFNPEFIGFIAQTTVNVANEHMLDFASIGVKYLEIGVEACDEEYLKSMRKPFNLGQLRKMTDQIRHDVHVGFIPNIIFGLPGARYEQTLAWLWLNADIISFINPFILSQYESSKGNMVEAQTDQDSNEQVMAKSWLTAEEVERSQDAMRQAFSITKGGEKIGY